MSNFTPEQYAERVNQAISRHVDEVFSSQARMIDEFTARLISAGSKQHTLIRDAISAQSAAWSEMVTESLSRFESVQHSLESRLSDIQSANESLSANLAALTRSHDAVEAKMAELDGVIEQANTAIAQSVQAKEAADRAKAEAVAEREKAESQIARAEKGMALMQLRAEAEVDRATWEAQSRADEKATLREINDERQRKMDEFDRREATINASISETFAGLSEKLDALMNPDGDDDA